MDTLQKTQAELNQIDGRLKGMSAFLQAVSDFFKAQKVRIGNQRTR